MGGRSAKIEDLSRSSTIACNRSMMEHQRHREAAEYCARRGDKAGASFHRRAAAQARRQFRRVGRARHLARRARDEHELAEIGEKAAALEDPAAARPLELARKQARLSAALETLAEAFESDEDDYSDEDDEGELLEERRESQRVRAVELWPEPAARRLEPRAEVAENS